tara:strand:+ start:4271 stop:4618 length:348 start_codon:yes stop_codon:yes gene_type:complete
MAKLTKEQKRKRKLTTASKLKTTKHQQLNLARKNKPELPPFITCNECGGLAPHETFEVLNTQGMTGVDLALSGICSDCNAPTIAASGEQKAVSHLMSVLKEEMGGGAMGADAFKK